MEEHKELITVLKQIVKELKTIRVVIERQQTRMIQREDAIQRVNKRS